MESERILHEPNVDDRGVDLRSVPGFAMPSSSKDRIQEPISPIHTQRRPRSSPRFAEESLQNANEAEGYKDRICYSE